VNRGYDPDDLPPPVLDVDAVRELYDRHRRRRRVARWIGAGLAALVGVFVLVVGLSDDDDDDDDDDDRDDSRGRAGTVVVRVLDAGELP
jgi:DNA-directed RNA polymerase specialized sigma24 family protein